MKATGSGSDKLYMMHACIACCIKLMSAPGTASVLVEAKSVSSRNAGCSCSTSGAQVQAKKLDLNVAIGHDDVI